MRTRTGSSDDVDGIGDASTRWGDDVDGIGGGRRRDRSLCATAYSWRRLSNKDGSPHLTVAGPAWHSDPYVLSPSPKSLVTLFDAEHRLGGVAGYDLAETTDENLERVATVELLGWAYLRSALYAGDSAWQQAQSALTGAVKPLGRVESKERAAPGHVTCPMNVDEYRYEYR